MMLKIFLISTCCFLFHLAANAQKRERAEAAFLKKINEVLTHSPESGLYMRDETTMTIERPFQIKGGILSVAVRYTKDSSVIKVRAEAPIYLLENVEYDYFLVLIFGQGSVIQVETGNGESTHIEKDLIHLGIPQKDGYQEKMKIKKLLDKLLVYYKTANPI